ncbi:AarF/ABC1/UbiB kinase family protein [Microbacterium sp. SLBN-146]|uniref:ABC1 kinase family protein n=1 Tax=Microbacterium sp. SLBN-146 TaxID=2768457 RepID=UPI0011527972|nr:AarF/UbiB family protein [Microbacterium sp. SLBN-146]TQJ29966.1 ubiquinone biosynthesis protein [Microbacterium sp. SLBN-146]
MPTWLIFAAVVLSFSLIAAWIVRRLLDTEIGWLRAWLTALVVFLLATPVAIWALTEADVYQDGAFVVAGPVALAFVALNLGWMFAAVFIVVMTLEFLWPSRRWRNPITVVRDAIRRRDRARRYAQILAIGSRHGLTFYESRRHGDEGELPSALVSAMNEAGVTFVKLGQVLSTREDVLPPPLIRALSTLQMDSSPIPWPEAEAAIAEQLGRPLDEVFGEIDPEPLAAASVAQVHAARLVDGDEVVVKIQRPRARAQVTTDLDILDRLAAEAERRTDWAKAYGAYALVQEFARGLREELDYGTEVANTEMLRSTVETAGSRLRIPRVYTECSTRQMIVQERVTGIPLSRLEPGALPLDRATDLADALVDAVIDHIAVRGIFHADLHPGNVILDEDDGTGQATLTLIDFGSVGIVESSVRRLLLPMLIGMANEDDVAVTDIVLMLCQPADGDVDATALQRDIGVILTRMHNSGMDENIFRLLLDVLRRQRIALPPSLLLVFRTLTSLEGTLRKLVPGYDMVSRALTTAPRIASSLVSLHGMALTAQTWSMLLGEQVRRLPRRIENVSRALEEGTLSVRLRSFESTDERRWVDGLLGRVTTTLIGIALVISGILLGVDDGGPMLTGNVPAFAFLGSIVGLGGLLLLLRSLRTALRRRP